MYLSLDIFANLKPSKLKALAEKSERGNLAIYTIHGASSDGKSHPQLYSPNQTSAGISAHLTNMIDHMICLHFFSLNFNGRREVREALHSIHIHESLEKKGESHKNAYRTWEGMEEDRTPSGGLSNTYTNGLALVKLGWEDFKLTFKCLGVTSV